MTVCDSLGNDHPTTSFGTVKTLPVSIGLVTLCSIFEERTINFCGLLEVVGGIYLLSVHDISCSLVSSESHTGHVPSSD